MLKRLFAIALLNAAFIIHAVHSHSLNHEEKDNNPHPNVRKKRGELDDEDVINRFELERVSPLQDIIFRNLPAFESDWIHAPPTNFPPVHPPTDKPTKDSSDFRLELSKDEEHVFSHSGGKYRGNSAVNWWYSVESYSNVTHYNFTDTESAEVSNVVDERKAVTRKQDEDHVVSHVPSLRTGGWSTLDEVVLESPTTPVVSVTPPPKTEQPNITTRYILLQSGRIVAINVTLVPMVLKPTSGNKPPAYFGSRIRKSNHSISHNVNTINKVSNFTSIFNKPPNVNRLAPLNTPEKLQNLRSGISVTTNSPFIVHNAVLTPPPSVRAQTPSERLHNLRLDVVTPKPLAVYHVSPLYHVDLPPIVRPRVFNEPNKIDKQTLPEKFANTRSNSPISNSPPLVHSSTFTVPPIVRTSQISPDGFQNLRTDAPLPNYPSVLHNSFHTAPPSVRTSKRLQLQDNWITGPVLNSLPLPPNNVFSAPPTVRTPQVPSERFQNLRTESPISNPQSLSPNNVLTAPPAITTTQAPSERLQNLRADGPVPNPLPLVPNNVLTAPPTVRTHQASPERFHNPRTDSPIINALPLDPNEVLTAPPTIRTTQAPSERLQNLRTDTPVPNFPPVVHNHNFSDPPTTITPQTTPDNFQNLRTNAPVTNPSSVIRTSVFSVPPIVVTPQVQPVRLQNLRTNSDTTKSPNIPRHSIRTTITTPPPTNRIQINTETTKVFKNELITTKLPTTIFVAPKTTANPTTETYEPTKITTKKIELPPPTKPTVPYWQLPTTKRESIPTRQPLVLSTLSVPKTTKPKYELFSGGIPSTHHPRSAFYTPPPRNILETILEVLQPETSEIPFLVVTFDSLKKQLPTGEEIGPSDSPRERPEKLIEFNGENERFRSTKPSLVHYSYNPYQRSTVATTQNFPTANVFTTTWSRNRGSPSTISEQRVSSNTDKDFSSTHSLPKVQYDIVRIGVPTVSTTPVPALKPKPESTTTRQPRYRGLSFVTGGQRQQSTSTTAKPSKKPRQNQAFHLRNSVGFQTSPPGAFSDRRAYSGSTTPPPNDPAEPAGRMKVEDAMALRFEPTRRNAPRAEHLQSPPTSAPLQSLTTNRIRSTTKRIRSTTTKKARSTSPKPTPPRAVVPPSRSPRPSGPPVAEERARPRKQELSRPAKETTRTSQRQRSSQPQVEKEDGGKDESKSTAKPFKVYYFEPKRKRQRKNSTEVNSAHDQRNRFATERVQLTTNRPPGRARMDQPQRAPRILSDTPRRNHPQVLRSAAPSKAPRQSTTRRPSNPQDQPRRGSARATASSTTPRTRATTTAPTTGHPNKKPWYSPFLRHQPNVGTATPSANITPGTTQRVPAVVRPTRSPLVRSTRPPPPARSTPLVEPFSLPPGDSFEELIFQPLEIRRIN
ncbi:uncharacterized protein CDAR_72331 [Caerostris darwini]|uniref:Mucin-2-like n=1 Tax=Caerostris darwini TaxID=1538125 RepID=A0AAV4MPV2_9ARAC|nr:uncharacterized protein CDAR_72331 [Caerostris darwini]